MQQSMTGAHLVDYSVFKGLQFVLFFGAAFGFGWWQLRSVRQDKKDLRKDKTP